MRPPAASARVGRDPAAAFQHDQQILDRSVAQGVGEDDIVADQLVALRVDHDDIALGADLAGLAVPDDLVGGEMIAVARHPHLARGGHDIGLAVVGDLVGAEIDDFSGLGRRWIGGRRIGGGRRCRLLERGRLCRSDCGYQRSGSAVHQTNPLRKQSVPPPEPASKSQAYCTLAGAPTIRLALSALCQRPGAGPKRLRTTVFSRNFP